MAFNAMFLHVLLLLINTSQISYGKQILVKWSSDSNFSKSLPITRTTSGMMTTFTGRHNADISTNPVQHKEAFIGDKSSDQKNILQSMTTDRSLFTSKWSTFVACGYWKFNKYNTRTKTEELFIKYFHHDFIHVEDMYDCSLNCSSVIGVIYFVFAKSFCHCIKDPKDVMDSNKIECSTSSSNAGPYYESSEGLPVFGFKNITTEYDESQSSEIPLMNLYQLNCLVNKSGKYELNQLQRCYDLLSKGGKCDDITDLVIPKSRKPRKIFVQWLCHDNISNRHMWFFRVIQHNSYDNLAVPHDLSTRITTTLHYFSSSRFVNTSTNNANNYGNIVLVSTTVLVMMASVGLFVRYKIMKELKESNALHAQQRNEIPQSREDSYNDGSCFVSLSSPVQINNEIYHEVNVSNKNPIQMNGDVRNDADPAGAWPVQGNNEMYSDVDVSSVCPMHISNETYGDIHDIIQM